MTEASPLVRQWILLRTLCARHHGVTVKELATELSVDQKTIRRDLDAFSLAGFPLLETIERFGRKRWRIDAAQNPPGVPFAYDEAIALHLARQFLEPLTGTLFGEAASRAFRKIRAMLGTGSLEYIERFAAIFHQTNVGTSDYSRKAALIDDLMVATEDRRAILITYRSLRVSKPIRYTIHPFGLIYHHGSLYLVGEKAERDSPRKAAAIVDKRPSKSAAVDDNPIRHWKIDRIENVKLEDVRFNRPEDFDLQKHFAKSFGVFQGDGEVHVKIRFSPTVARYVAESAWHTSQKLTSQQDGGLLAEFDLDSTEEIMHWIMSFGRHAEVIEPKKLRNKIKWEACAMVRLIDSNADANHE